MRVVLKPLPVLYACQGCPEFGQLARDVGVALDREAVAELVWLGDGKGGVRDLRPTQRFPVFSLDACAKGCARRWLAERGIAAQRSYVLNQDGAAAGRAAKRIAAQLGRPGIVSAG
jgi:uncharacterized metal-binding protein